ncbi:hypothetical protein [Sinorhizobium arboris]|uniref:hypothetical protein n=1 Tax=Sinorhizobium arboris TaxID=76745 RepID=UPI0012434728|nr:hypothetical protein [Sinorhizobium arboris]
MRMERCGLAYMRATAFVFLSVLAGCTTAEMHKLTRIGDEKGKPIYTWQYDRNSNLPQRIKQHIIGKFSNKYCEGPARITDVETVNRFDSLAPIGNVVVRQVYLTDRVTMVCERQPGDLSSETKKAERVSRLPQ